MNTQGKLHVIGNLLGLLVICIILGTALADQLLRHDLPCPLCLLQRIAYVAIGICMMMNLYLSIRPAHYGLMILATLFGLGVAVRQLTLHLDPGDPGYGFPVLGHYLYTWSAIGFIIILILIAVALLLDRGVNIEYKIQHQGCKIIVAIFLLLILVNGISTFMECGPYTCPADPTAYYF